MSHGGTIRALLAVVFAAAALLAAPAEGVENEAITTPDVETYPKDSVNALDPAIDLFLDAPASGIALDTEFAISAARANCLPDHQVVTLDHV